jgi:FkbM family methyltransferase
MNSAFFTFIKYQLSKVGLHIARIPRNGVHGVSLQRDLRVLISGSTPTFFDVGANVGQTIELLKTIFPASTIYSFEPSSETFRILSSKVSGANIRLLNIALGDTNKTANFINYESSTLSSFFELQRCERNPFHDVQQKKPESVAVRTVDGIVEEECLSQIDLLKIDTQGYELAVLKGAVNSLQNALVKNVLAELTFAPLYHEQSDPIKVIRLLENHHFGLVDLYEKTFDGQRLAWCTALFHRI